MIPTITKDNKTYVLVPGEPLCNDCNKCHFYSEYKYKDIVYSNRCLNSTNDNCLLKSSGGFFKQGAHWVKAYNMDSLLFIIRKRNQSSIDFLTSFPNKLDIS